MTQVHKENLTHVENANSGRQGLEIEIFGMEGVPAEIIDQHNQQVTQAHFAEEAERARLTGNPVRGQYTNGSAPPNKRAKVTETLEEIEQRAEQYREDRKNGVLPVQAAPAVQEVGNPVCLKLDEDVGSELTRCRHHQRFRTPTAHPQPPSLHLPIHRQAFPLPTPHPQTAPALAAYPANLAPCPRDPGMALRPARSHPVTSTRYSSLSTTLLRRRRWKLRRRRRTTRRARRTRTCG
jgi:hypothetical protein